MADMATRERMLSRLLNEKLNGRGSIAKLIFDDLLLQCDLFGIQAFDVVEFLAGEGLGIIPPEGRVGRTQTKLVDPGRNMMTPSKIVFEPKKNIPIKVHELPKKEYSKRRPNSDGNYEDK